MLCVLFLPVNKAFPAVGESFLSVSVGANVIVLRIARIPIVDQYWPLYSGFA